MSLLPFPETRDMVWDYMPELNRPLFGFYYFLLVVSGLGLIALFQYRIPVSVAAAGVVRPAQERTEVHSVVGGTIERMFVREGDTVTGNSLLFILRDGTVPAAASANENELSRQQEMVEDLQRLTDNDGFGNEILRSLKTPLYREQAAAYLSRAEGDELNLAGAKHEADLGRILLEDKVISPKEFYDQQLRENKMRSAFNTQHRNQWAAWQAELFQHRQAFAACMSRKTEYAFRAEQLEVRAPVTGIVYGLRSWYPGCSVRPDQLLCSVSPEGNLVGECYVPSRDAGLLHRGQALRIRMDAFNANHFGLLSGSILSVSNDITVVDGKAVFTVRCLFDPPTRDTKNGYRGLMKKGLSFQARCIVTERTLFQLLYDNLEDWVNPGSLSPYSA